MAFALAYEYSLEVNFAHMLKPALINFPINKDTNDHFSYSQTKFGCS